MAERIRAYDGQPIVYEGREIPIRLHIAVTKLSSNPDRDWDLFEELYQAICDVKE